MAPPASLNSDCASVSSCIPSYSEWYEIRITKDRGRGLYAKTDIPARTVIHVAPCIVASLAEYGAHLCHTIMHHYLFNLRDGRKLVPLGHAGMFNHRRMPNVDYRCFSGDTVGDGSGGSDDARIVFVSGREIKIGEELCIYYGNDLWFDDADGSDSASEEDQDDDGVGFLRSIEL